MEWYHILIIIYAVVINIIAVVITVKDKEAIEITICCTFKRFQHKTDCCGIKRLYHHVYYNARYTSQNET